MCAAAGDIYDVFLNEARVKAFTMSDATVSKDVDGKFSMFGGSIEGFHRELVSGKKIVQDWRFTTWPDGVFSKARLLACSLGRTQLRLWLGVGWQMLVLQLLVADVALHRDAVAS